MDLDWKDLAGPLLGKGLAGLGTALGGPVGGAVGALVGPLLAQALGVEATPEAVAEAVATRPAAEVKAAAEAVERDNAGAIAATAREAEARMLAEINETARLELASESRFVRWARPFNIWVIGVVTGGYGACLVAATAAAVIARDTAALNLLVANAGVLGIALAPCGAVAGIASWGRTREKLAGASLVATGIDAVKAVSAKAGRR